MHRLAAHRVSVALLVLAVALLIVMAILGSGSHADARCMDSYFVGGGDWSWLHLGTRCEYGEPSRTGYARSWLLVPWLLTLGAAAFTWHNKRLGSPASGT